MFTNCSRNDIVNRQVPDSLISKKSQKSQKEGLLAQISTEICCLLAATFSVKKLDQAAPRGRC